MTSIKEALEPFAAAFPTAFDHRYLDNDVIVLLCNDQPCAWLKIVDFRRVRAALAQLESSDALEALQTALAENNLTTADETVVYASTEAVIDAILATGLVPDEASIRANERDTFHARHLADLLARVLALGNTGGWRRMPDGASFSSLPLAEDIAAAIRAGRAQG